MLRVTNGYERHENARYGYHMLLSCSSSATSMGFLYTDIRFSYAAPRQTSVCDHSTAECCTLCHLSYRCYRYCFRLCSALLATIVRASKIQVTVLSIVNRQLGVQELACCTCPIAFHSFLSSTHVETPFSLLPRMQAQCSIDCEGW